MNVKQFSESCGLCVVDIGASGGLSEPFRHKPNIQAIFVEPDERAATELERQFPGVRLLRTALSNTNGRIPFYLARDQECSSCLEPNMDFLSRFPNPERFATVRRLELDSATLDSQMAAVGADPDFIKLDVQGYESHILEGSARCLTRTMGAIIEVEFVPLYHGQKLFPDVHLTMTAAGFELYDLQRSFWKRSANGRFPMARGQCLFGNALYLKSPETIVKMYGDDPNKLYNAARLYHLFGYGDLLEVISDLLEHEAPSVAAHARKLASDLIHEETTPVSFLRKKMHGAIVRLERLCRRLRKRLLLTDHFAQNDADLGNTITRP